MSIPALTVRTLALLFTLALASFGQTSSLTQIWTVIAVDTRSDGRDPSLADAAQLSYRYDPVKDELWFRVTLYGTRMRKRSASTSPLIPARTTRPR
jgi:hypothetical protein